LSWLDAEQASLVATPAMGHGLRQGSGRSPAAAAPGPLLGWHRRFDELLAVAAVRLDASRPSLTSGVL
jgi:hypothetical protein